MTSKAFRNLSLFLQATAIVLLLVSPSTCKISKYVSDIDPFTFTGKGNNYQFRLDKYFNLLEAKYPINIEVSGLDTKDSKVGYTYQRQAYKLEAGSNFQKLQSLYIVNHNNLIVAGSVANPTDKFIDEIACGSPKAVDALECHKFTFKLPLAQVSVDHNLEATRFDERSGLYVLAFRNAKTNELVLYAKKPSGKPQGNSESNDNVEFIKIQLKNSKTQDIMISNRVRMEILSSTKQVKTDKGTQTVKYSKIYVFDQTTKNGKDKPFSGYLIAAEITGTLSSGTYSIAAAGNYKLNDSEKQLKADTISTLYEHEGEIFVQSERQGSDGIACLTRINEPSGDSFTLAPKGYGFFCSNISGGTFFGMSNGNELLQLVTTDKTQELRIFSLTDSSQPNLSGTFIKTVKLTTSLQGKDGVREIFSGTNAYTIRFSMDQGVNDTGKNTLTVIRTQGLEDEFYSADNEADVVINSIQIQATVANTYFKMLGQPFIFFTDSKLEDGKEVKTEIKLTDSETTEAVIVNASFTRFDDALAKVQIKDYNPIQVEIDPFSLTRHYFPYTNVEMGNSIEFDINYNEGKAINKLVPMCYQKQKHTLTLPESSSSKILEFVINSSAAIFVDGMGSTINYYICDAENAFATQCFLSQKVPTHGITFYKHLGATNGVSMTIGEKKIITASGKEKMFYYFSWFIHKDLLWDYEVYDKKIIDVGHTTTMTGDTFTIIAFEDSIQVGRFFSGWTYGNRDITVFDSDDVDVDKFCPSNIMFNAQLRNVFYVLSNCKDSQNLIQFVIKDPKTPKFVNSRWIASDSIPKPKKACILPGEMIIFEVGSDKAQKNTLTSYDRSFSFTKSSINSKVYGLTNFYDFACVAELNVFITLNDDDSQEGNDGEKEIVVYRGGTAMQGMRRVLFRVSKLSSKITSLLAYAHQKNKVVIIGLDDGKNQIEIFNVDVNAPVVATRAEVSSPPADPFKLSITVKNIKNIVDKTNGNLKILQPLSTAAPKPRSVTKVDMKQGKNDVSPLLKMQTTPIEDCDLVGDDGKEVTDQTIYAVEDDTNSALGTLSIGDKIGNYERFQEGTYDVVSYYNDQSSSTLDFGKISIFTRSDKGVYTESSQLVLPNTLRFVNTVSDERGYLYHVLVSNEGVGSSLKLTLSYKGVLSTKTFNIDEYNFFHKAHIFLHDKTTVENAETSVKLTVVAYSELMNILTAYDVTVTLGEATTGKNDDWKATVDYDTDSSNPNFRIKEYDFTHNPKENIINFYLVTIGNVPSVGRITYNKETGKFVDDKLQSIKFEGSQNQDSQVYGIGCVRDVTEAAKGVDRCAFSTFGAVVYYAEMEDKVSVSFEDGLKQTPSSTVTMKRVLRLRRINQNFGKKVFVLGKFVVLETERLSTAQTKAALIWDVSNYDKYGAEQEFGVDQVVALTQENSKQSQFDSILINAVNVAQSPFKIDEFELVVMNEDKAETEKQQKKASYKIGLKRMNHYVLDVKKMPTADAFSKLKMKCTSISGQTFSVPLSSIFNAPKSVQKDL